MASLSKIIVLKMVKHYLSFCLHAIEWKSGEEGILKGKYHPLKLRLSPVEVPKTQGTWKSIIRSRGQKLI